MWFHFHNWSPWGQEEKESYHREGTGGPHGLDRAEYETETWRQRRFCTNKKCNLVEYRIVFETERCVRLFR